MNWKYWLLLVPREVAFVAYFFGFDDPHVVCSVDLFGLHSLSNELRRHQSWFSAIGTPIRLDHSNQGLEVLHVLCVGHVVGLVIRGDSVLRLLKGICTLLMVVEAAAIPLGD